LVDIILTEKNYWKRRYTNRRCSVIIDTTLAICVHVAENELTLLGTYIGSNDTHEHLNCAW